MADERPLSERLIELIDQGNAARESLRESVTEARAAIRDLHDAVKEARAEIRSLARAEVQKQLARESETIAAEIRKRIKTGGP